jgi:hypothetical protein
MKGKLSFFYVLLLAYLAIWVILKFGEGWWNQLGVNLTVLHGAHLILWLITLFTYRMAARSFSNPNPQVSVRALLLGMIVKFLVISLAAFVYIIFQRKQVNIPALVGSAVLYIIYTVLETNWLLKALKRPSHG